MFNGDPFNFNILIIEARRQLTEPAAWLFWISVPIAPVFACMIRLMSTPPGTAVHTLQHAARPLQPLDLQNIIAMPNIICKSF